MAAADQEALIRQLEFLAYKARYGMGMPFCQRDVDHYESLIAEARRRQPDDPGVELARKLASTYLASLDDDEFALAP